MPTVHRDVGNIRITYVPANERPQSTDWSGSDVVRLQAYRDTRQLNPGPEYPVVNERDFIDLIRTLSEVYMAGRA